MKLAPENINYRERERKRERVVVSLVKVGAKDYFSFNYHETFPQRECRFSERSKLENECVFVCVRVDVRVIVRNRARKCVRVKGRVCVRGERERDCEESQQIKAE